MMLSLEVQHADCPHPVFAFMLQIGMSCFEVYNLVLLPLVQVHCMANLFPVVFPVTRIRILTLVCFTACGAIAVGS